MKESNKLDIKKGDITIILLALMVTIVLLLIAGSNNPGELVHIMSDGKKETYSLLDNQEISLKNSTGAVNELVIQNRQVYMKSADCPDQVCVHHRPISKNGEMIVCLPNEVFVEIESSADNEVDN